MFHAYVAVLFMAQQAVAASGQASSRTAVSDVVVQAARPEAVARIDRNVYDIKNDPQAQGAPLIDILGKLPSVSVAPTGRVQLLGAPGVTVMVDGKPVSSDKLGVMTGADVDKVEVMTNPSAQYAAQGGAGIINIITRRRYGGGWSGSVTARAENDGDAEAVLSPTLAFGKWSVGGMLTAGRAFTESDSRRVRALSNAGLASETRSELIHAESDSHRVGFNPKVTYRPTDRQLLTLTGQLFGFDVDRDSRRAMASDDAAFAAYVERQDGDLRYTASSVGLTYEWTGSHDGETLKLDGSLDRSRWRQASAFEDAFAASSRRFSSLQDARTHEAEAKLDYARPIGAKRLLTTGAAWSRTNEDLATGFSNPASDPGLGAGFARRLTDRRDLAAIYGTFQFPLGAWTALPGLRLEADDFSLAAAGGAVHADNVDLFPTLHVSRPLTKALNLKFSYTRRIQRPDASRLDPSINYDGSTHASTGNPDLKPVTTHGYEARLDYQLKGHGLNLTVYDREQHDAWNTLTRRTPEGVFLTTTINTGRAVYQGAEASVRGPIGGRWKYAATLNLYQFEGLVLDSGRLRSNTTSTYSGTTQLDYKGPAKGDHEGDQVQLSLRYNGPDQGLQQRYSDSVRADLTWRRALTPKISAVLVITDLFDSMHYHWRTLGDDFVETGVSREPAPNARLSLTYKLGGKS
jgi:ferric enterobactin receptor